MNLKSRVACMGLRLIKMKCNEAMGSRRVIDVLHVSTKLRWES